MRCSCVSGASRTDSSTISSNLQITDRFPDLGLYVQPAQWQRLTHDEVALATAVRTNVETAPGKAVVQEKLSRMRDDLPHQTIHPTVSCVLKDEGERTAAVRCKRGRTHHHTILKGRRKRTWN